MNPDSSTASETQVDPPHALRAFTPDFRVQPDNTTVLMADDARLPDGVQRNQVGGHGKFEVSGWTRANQVFRWDVHVTQSGDYSVNVLVDRLIASPLKVTVTGGGQRVEGDVETPTAVWDRCALSGTLHLEQGAQTVTLEASARDGQDFAASVFSIELVRPAVREQLHQAALKLRADTLWLQQARFGLMFHWTAETMPRHGTAKPYAEAVRDFDVEAFANQVKATGAGFVVMTTAHAQMYFPAPVAALDHLLPGRTAPRDLVADLADALNKRGVKLMLYYHIGAISDPQWLAASGFWETDTTRIFDNWRAIIGEIGQRYGDRLAGWWFDDGTVNYYYRSAPWERLTCTAKQGNPQRLVGYNSWFFPAATEFQDFYCGETIEDPSVGGWLPEGGDGRLAQGSHRGLQACATLLFDGDWAHLKLDTPIPPPLWNAEQLASLLQSFAAYKNVPIFNCEIYQDGTLSPQSVETLRQAAIASRL